MNPQSLSSLIALGEGFTTEFKRAMPSDLGREMCAFANATGGVIMLGISDAGEIVGVADHNQLKSRVQSTARSAEPPISVEVESVGEVLCVKVPYKYPTSTLQVRRLLRVLDGERSRAEILARLELKDRLNLMTEYLRPALVAGLVEMTIPDKPRSSKQRYRLTAKGRDLLAELDEGEDYLDREADDRKSR